MGDPITMALTYYIDKYYTNMLYFGTNKNRFCCKHKKSRNP